MDLPPRAGRSPPTPDPLPPQARLRHPARALAARRAAPDAARHAPLPARLPARPPAAALRGAADRRARLRPGQPWAAALEPALARALAPGVRRPCVARALARITAPTTRATPPAAAPC